MYYQCPVGTRITLHLRTPTAHYGSSVAHTYSITLGMKYFEKLISETIPVQNFFIYRLGVMTYVATLVLIGLEFIK